MKKVNIQKIHIIFIIAVTILGLIIRYFVRDLISDDLISYLIPWFNEIKAKGGLHGGLKEQVGNYNFTYQLFIAIFSSTSINPIYIYKSLSILFDYLLAMASALTVYNVSKNINNALYTYSLVVLSPLVLLNSSVWGQCDSIYTFWIILAIFTFLRDDRKGNNITFILLGIALSCKLQAVFIFPFFGAMYLIEKKFSIWKFGIIPLTTLGIDSISLLFGRNLFDIISIYSGQISQSNKITYNYPSFWEMFFTKKHSQYLTTSTQQILIIITLIILLFIIFLIKHSKIKMGKNNILYIAFILTYTTIIFLPSMHERYGYISEILALILVYLNKKTIPLFIMMQLVIFFRYSASLIGIGMGYNHISSYINVSIYLMYCILFTREMKLNHID